jgi:hypothetical protein
MHQHSEKSMVVEQLKHVPGGGVGGEEH